MCGILIEPAIHKQSKRPFLRMRKRAFNVLVGFLWHQIGENFILLDMAGFEVAFK